jgi:hypothetical protein
MGCLLASLALAALPASAVIIDSGDGTGNTEAPSDDPGWRNVSYRGSRSAVYLGNSWVITALHVGVGHVKIDAVQYAMLPDSDVIVTNEDGTGTDLVLFQIDGSPPLPNASISESTPPHGTPLILIGKGLRRGDPFRFGGLAGFRWAGRAPMRWGTSVVSSRNAFGEISGTETFAARFSLAGSVHEAIAARGDSGGAAFVRGSQRWELAGIMLAVGSYPGQPAKTAVYGNQTYMADLSVYRDQIRRIMRGHPAASPASKTETTD